MRSKWARMAMTSVVALATLAPVASARDRCERRGYDGRASYTSYGANGYRSNGYRDSGYRDSGYRDSGYRDYGYRDYGYRNQGYAGYPEYREPRSAGKSAAIIGGGAAAGAVIGGLAGGGKGAAVGAVVGGIGGVVVDRTTRNRDNYNNNYGRRW